MNLSIKKFITFIFVGLVAVNIAIFMQSIKLSDKIHYYEDEIAKLQEQNLEYEQQIYKIESITNTASLAAELDFAHYNDPIYIESPQYARSN